MKKYACNRLYIHGQQALPQSVVTLNDRGEVTGHAPLAEETSFTEWIGGIIVVTGWKEWDASMDFKKLTAEKTNAKQPQYAWHIAPFDFQKEELTPESIIRRL